MLHPSCPCVLALTMNGKKLPHFILTSNKDWDPIVHDCEGQVDNDAWFYVQLSFPDSPNDAHFNEVGYY